MCSCFLHGIVIRQQFHLNKGYLSPHCSTTGGVRAVHVSTAKFIQIYFAILRSTLPVFQNAPNTKTNTKTEMSDDWKLKYKNPHICNAQVRSYDDTDDNDDANSIRNSFYDEVTAARISKSMDLPPYLMDDYNNDHDDETSDKEILILVAKLAVKQFRLTMELVSVFDDSIRSSNSIRVVRSKSVYWPNFVNERIVNLGFLRSYKDSSHREDGAMLELLGALDFSRNLHGVSKQNEIVGGSSFEHDVGNVMPPLRLILLTDRGGVTMYDPFLFFDDSASTKSINVLENLFLGSNGKFEQELISGYDAVWRGDLSVT